MRDLAKAFRSTSGTGASGSAMADKSVNQPINALGQLSTKLDGTKRTRAEELQAMKRFAANVNRATNAQEAQAEAIANNIKRQKDAADAAAESARKSALSAEELAAEQKAALRQQIQEESKARNNMLRDSINNQRRTASSSREVFDELNSTGGSLELLKGKFLDLGGNSLNAQAGLQLFASAVQGTAKALTTYSAALYKGERGAQVSAKAFSDLANPILDTVDKLGNLVSFMSIFVPGGILVKGAVALGGGLISLASNAGKLAVKFQEVGAKQADDLFKSFREISQVGAATAGGMDDVFNNLQTLGMTVSEIEDYNKLIVSSGQKLGLLGAAADGGKKAFAEVAGGLVKSELGRNLELMGVSAAEQREAALTYMSIQARTGQLELKNTKQLIDESSKFVKELDMAARLTGQTRKEQEAAREANMAESRYRAALFAAQQRGDQPEVARLQKAGDMAAMLRGLGMTEQATGTLQYAAGGNAMTTPEAIQAAMSLGLAEVLNNPNITAVGALQQSLANSKEQLEYLAETNKFTGEITAIQGNIPKTLDAITRLENIQKAADKEDMTVEQFLGTKQGQMMLAPEKNTKLMTDAGRAQQSAAMMMDSVVYSFNYAVDIHETATKTFKEAVDTFAKVTGARTPEGGTYATGGPGQGGPGATQTAADATAIAKATREIADATAERAATAIDVENEAKRELERLKQINASKQQQQEAEKKVAAAATDRAKLEEQERNDAINARQKALEAKNKRLAEQKAANAAKMPGAKPQGATPQGSTTQGNTPTTSVPTGPSSTDYMSKLVQAESGGKNIANRSGQGGTSTSTAFGLTQFTKGTFEGLVKNAASTNPLYGKTWEDYKGDTKLQMEATRQLTDQNRAFLSGNKLSTTDSALYLAHFLGPSGARKALSFPDSAPIASVVSVEQLAANPGLQEMSTVGDLKAWADKKMGGVGYAMGGIVRSKSGGTQITVGEGSFNEAVVPLPDGKTIPVSFGRDINEIFKSPALKNIGKHDAELASVSQKINEVLNSPSLKNTSQYDDTKLASFGQKITEVLNSSALKNLSTLDIVTPLNNILAKMNPSTGNGSDSANTASQTEFDSKLVASTIASEIRSAVKDMLQQPQNSDQSVLVAVMQDMIREQKTTNTINQRILQVSQS